ncbi:GNAT family N-acetyltransferase [Polaribacter porphyrae]|uniref:N-acetyltransferase domain-containing protein n=1 Tax=Polaribacter porphyrae TaxID=1137780 RepID=A0A2S7WSF9_9FLAO|nr:GNAT family N-acetyltransferase [Polaribacter porphyrae]PQJ80251.1 hypothetical protein BTO18_14160 [Polaribacter porphyrae]
MDYLVEKASIKNLDEILSLFKNTIEKTCCEDYNKSQISAWISSVENRERWIHKIKNQYFIIVKTKNLIVGFGSLEQDYIDFLYVHHNFLRKGIASILYESLKKESQKLGFIKLTTHSSKTAFPFFASKGFQLIKENTITRKGVEISNFEMKKVISY